MEEYRVVFCTVPSRDVAEKIADKLVGDRLAACVNILGGVRSIYTWKGEVCRDDELLLVIKSRAALFESLRAAVIALHPYEVPEIISLPIQEGHEPYMQWLRENTSADA